MNTEIEMGLIIKPPCYYSKHFEEIKEVTAMCDKIMKTINLKNYGDTFQIIRLAPAIAPKPEFDKGLWTEDIGFDWKYGYAFIFIRSDF